MRLKCLGLALLVSLTLPLQAAAALKAGDQGLEVRALQQKLSAAGLRTTANGVYGAETVRQVRTFQALHGLPKTGTADDATLAALEKAGAKAPSPKVGPQATGHGPQVAKAAPSPKPQTPSPKIGAQATSQRPQVAKPTPGPKPQAPSPKVGPQATGHGPQAKPSPSPSAPSPKISAPKTPSIKGTPVTKAPAVKVKEKKPLGPMQRKVKERYGGKKQSAQVINILRTAASLRGVPYRFGGTSPGGFDCSGYVQYVFGRHGVWLPRMCDSQLTHGVRIARKNLRPGDLVFFETYEPGASHVGIYAGNNSFWHASSSRGVMLSGLHDSYWRTRYYSACRVLR